MQHGSNLSLLPWKHTVSIAGPSGKFDNVPFACPECCLPSFELDAFHAWTVWFSILDRTMPFQNVHILILKNQEDVTWHRKRDFAGVITSMILRQKDYPKAPLLALRMEEGPRNAASLEAAKDGEAEFPLDWNPARLLLDFRPQKLLFCSC